MEESQIKRLRDELDWNRPVEVQERAVHELVQLGPAVLDVLPKLWQGSQKRHWQNIVKIIRGIGYPANAAAIPTLLKRLMDINWPGSIEAAEELLQIGEPIIPHVRKVLQEHWDDCMWMWFIQLLLQGMDPAVVAPLVPELLHLLDARKQIKEPDWDADWAAIETLAHIGSPAADSAVPLLVERAIDRSRPEEKRIDALVALRRFTSPPGAEALTNLQPCLEDPSDEIRRSARATLEVWQRANAL